MSNKKYIFLDIDGTLLDSDGTVLDSTVEALRLTQQKGNEIFVSSGRARKLVPDVLENLNFDGFVSGTGTYVEYKGKVIFQQSFDRDLTNKLIKFFNDNNMPFMLSANGSCAGRKKDIALFVECFSEGAIKAEEVNDMFLVDNPFFKSIQPIAIDDDVFSYYDKYKYITDFIFLRSPVKVSELDNLLGDKMHAEKASFKTPDEFSGEVTLSDYTKATGIECLLNYVGAGVDDSIGVGDGFNDIDMLNFTGTSIAMGNAPDEIKSVSDYITDDIKNDGIYKAFKNFDLI